MRITQVRIENFRCLKDVQFEFLRMVCIVGRNNAGKSSLLAAISHFFSNSKLPESDFYDSSQPVTIDLQLVVREADLSRLPEGHRKKLREFCNGENLTLRKRYQRGEAGAFYCFGRRPKDSRFGEEVIDNLLKGKKGKQIKQVLDQHYPELAASSESVTTISAAKELVAELVRNLPEAEFEPHETVLPSGMNNSIQPLFPEVILIPAVKDFSDEVKSKDASYFGKIIKALVEKVQETEQVRRVQDALEVLAPLLTVAAGGEDVRLQELRTIEETIQAHLAAQFQAMKLRIEIPTPELKTFFSNARITLNDGLEGSFDSKGDGVKRAVLFALLRAYVDLTKRTPVSPSAAGYLFLFEEPELYLHPYAQRKLVDMLSIIAADQQVCMTTHSPYFLSPDATGSFVRIRKQESSVSTQRPYAELHTISLTEVSERDLFQLICYENSAAAFFCERVVLIEGDCDLIYLKHLAKLLNPDWDFDAQHIALVRCNGNGGIKRYRDFFRKFHVDVSVITDLDTVIDQFSVLGASDRALQLHGILIQQIDRQIQQSPQYSDMAPEDFSKLSRGPFRNRYQSLRPLIAKLECREPITDDEINVFKSLLTHEQALTRRRVLIKCDEVRQHKESLLAELRLQHTHVLSAGTIEDYMPESNVTDNKTKRAIQARSMVTSRAVFEEFGPRITDSDGRRRLEFDVIFEQIFGNSLNQASP
jgi:putative ATP-dependent endonuclease of the OLD family